MKNKTKWLIIPCVIFIAIFLIILIFVKSLLGAMSEHVDWFSVRAYQGDRITVNLHVTIDGKPAKISQKGIGYIIKSNDGFQTLTDRANDYNTYEYSLIINNNEKPISLHITVKHWNWWEIVESNLYIDIDTWSNSYKTHETYRYTAENPIYHYETKSEPEETVEGIDSIELYAGCKG